MHYTTKINKETLILYKKNKITQRITTLHKITIKIQHTTTQRIKVKPPHQGINSPEKNDSTLSSNTC